MTSLPRISARLKKTNAVLTQKSNHPIRNPSISHVRKHQHVTIFSSDPLNIISPSESLNFLILLTIHDAVFALNKVIHTRSYHNGVQCLLCWLKAKFVMKRNVVVIQMKWVCQIIDTTRAMNYLSLGTFRTNFRYRPTIYTVLLMSAFFLYRFSLPVCVCDTLLLTLGEERTESVRKHVA